MPHHSTTLTFPLARVRAQVGVVLRRAQGLLVSILFLSLALMAGGISLGDTVSWQVGTGTTGSWFVADNWAVGPAWPVIIHAVPSPNDWVMVSNGGTAQIAGGSAGVGRLSLGNRSTVVVSGGSLYLANDYSNIDMASNSNLVLSTGSLSLFGYQSYLNIRGGSTLNQSGGSLDGSFSEYIANGTVIQSGGTHVLRCLPADLPDDPLAEPFTGMLVLSSGGSYNLQNGGLWTNLVSIGDSGSATFTQSGGVHTIGWQSGYFDTFYGTSDPYQLKGLAGDLVLGNSPGSNGTYTLQNGSLWAINETIGNSGNGTFIQTGGWNAVSGTVVVAANTGSGGTFRLQGGTLTAGAVVVHSGGSFVNSAALTLTGSSFSESIQGGGTFTQNPSGSLTIQINGPGYDQYGQLFAGSISLAGSLNVMLADGLLPPNGYYFDILYSNSLTGNFSNGDYLEAMSASGIPSGVFFRVSTHSVGVWLQTVYVGSWAQPQNGTWSTATNWKHSISPASTIDANFHTGSSIPYTASLSANSAAQNLRVQGDDVTLALSGSMLTVAGGIFVDGSDGRTGSLSLSGPGSLSATYLSNNGLVTISGGTLTTTGNQIHGGNNPGQITQNGGANIVQSVLYLGYNVGFPGTYILQNGSLSANDVFVGNGAIGTFTQTGGTHTVAGTMTIGSADSASEYRLQGGNLTAHNEQIGHWELGNATFTQTGGTHTVTGTITISAPGFRNTSASSATYTLLGGTLTANNIHVSSGAFNVRTAQDTPLAQTFINTGVIDLGGATPSARLIVAGDFGQGGAGTLKVQIDGTGSDQYSQLVIGGAAHLGGLLQVRVGTNFEPKVGDKFPVIRYNSVNCRFDGFDGAVIKDINGTPKASDRFFGLLYQKDHLDVATLQVPQRMASNGTTSPLTAQGASGLILITHGYTGSVSDWPTDCALDIATPKVAQNWDVVTMDWSEYADPAGLFGGGPSLAAANANDIGESLANWMREKGYSYSNLHLIGHSAGSWLINGLTQQLKLQGSNAFIQQTYLDAFDPNLLDWSRLGATAPVQLYGYANGDRYELGHGANFAEQYCDGADFLKEGTATTLPGAVNFDIQKLVNWSINPVTKHATPYYWYENTVLNPTLGFDEKAMNPAGVETSGGGGFGFPVSLEYSGNLPQYGDFRAISLDGKIFELFPGVRIALPSGYAYNATTYEPPVDHQATQHVTTGNVTFNDGNPVLTAGSSSMAMTIAGLLQPMALTPASASPSGSPSILTEEIDLLNPAELINVSGVFTSSGHGLLTVYMDGVDLIEISETDAGVVGWDTGDFFMPTELQAGIHTLMFRLDSFDGLDSVVEITNVQFGSAMLVAPVPEATSLVLFGLGATGLLMRRRRAA
jgi:hypothetical protein